MENRKKEALLSVENLKTFFHTSRGTVKAVNGISFTLSKDETLGIVGESGSGKTMSALSVMRLVPKPTGKIESGSIYFEGKDLLALSEREMQILRGKQISMVFQDPMTSIDPVFTIGYQMLEIIKAHLGLKGEAARQKAVEALTMVGIPDAEERLDSYPHEFSGGMRQRVIIAMAIVCEPKMIIADEPTTALDVTVQSQVLELLKSLQRKLGTPIMIITHNIGVVWDICTTVAVMYKGKIVEYAKVGDLYKTPIHPYTWGLLDSVPKVSQDTNEPLAVIESLPTDRLSGEESCVFSDRCKYREDICFTETPSLIEVQKEHWAACHFQKETLGLTRTKENNS